MPVKELINFDTLLIELASEGTLFYGFSSYFCACATALHACMAEGDSERDVFGESASD